MPYDPHIDPAAWAGYVEIMKLGGVVLVSVVVGAIAGWFWRAP